MRVIVGGGSGFIGGNLCQSLKSSGHQVTIISRSPGPGRITWDQLNKEGLPPSDAIIQIPGANIMEKSWTPERRKEIRDSRIGTTKTLMKAIQASSQPPKVLVCGSAVGFYPTSSTDALEFDEYYKGDPAKNFSGELCAEWENVILQDKEAKKLRKVVVRTGIVLGKDGGALKSMLLPFKLGLGGRTGSGTQYWPWIHMEDIVGIFQHSIENESATGIFNGTAPQAVTSAVSSTNGSYFKEFAKTLAKVLNRPAIIPTPEFAIKLLFQERATLLTEGHKIVPKRVIESGYKFKFPNLKDALTNLVG